MEITIWERKIEGEWTHNHISDGYDPERQAPVAVNKQQQQAWAGAEWRSSRGQLVGNEVVSPYDVCKGE